MSETRLNGILLIERVHPHILLSLFFKLLCCYRSDNGTEFEIADKVYMVNVDPALETPFLHPFQYNIQIKPVSDYLLFCRSIYDENKAIAASTIEGFHNY